MSNGGMSVYKNRAAGGALNLCGSKIAQLRRAHTPALSQRALADQLQLCGLDVDKNAIQRMEQGKRFELRALAKFFQVSADELLED